MKGKRINPIERHGEKLFFVLALAALLLVLFKQFATGGMTVKVGSKDGLSISQGYDTIASQAERIQGQIKSNEIDAQAPKQAPDVMGRLQAAIPTVGDDQVAVIPMGIPDSPTNRGPLGPSGPIAEGAEYAMPAPVAPAAPQVKRYAGAIDPATVVTTPGLEEFVGAQQPYDLHAITVSTTFDAEALRASFSKDPDGSGPIQPIPGHWWRGQLVLLDVELWREEILEDGASSGATLVAPLPGFASVRAILEDPDTPMPQILSAVTDHPGEITRPTFYPVIAGEIWSPAAPPVKLSAKELEAKRRRADIARLDEEIASQREALDEISRGATGDRRSQLRRLSSGLSDAVAGGRPGGGGRGARQGGGNNRSNNAAQSAREARERRIKAIETRIDELRSQREEQVAWLTEQGLPIEAAAVVDPGIALLKAAPGSLKDANTINVWATDCGVEPGATYRYRIRLVYGNPFYGRDNVIREDQRQTLCGSRVIRSDYSPWSEPVTMDEKSYYYLTRVSGGGNAIGQDSGRIVYAEVYTFFYGFWRRSEVRLRPGDPIVGEFQLPELETFEFAPGADDQVNLGSIARTPMDTVLPRSLGSVMLDVRPSARVNRDALKGGRDSEPEYEAVMLDEHGVLEVRQPEVDRASERRRAMRASAELGENAVVATPGQGGVAQIQIKGSQGPGGDRDSRDERGGGSREDRGIGRGGIGG